MVRPILALLLAWLAFAPARNPEEDRAALLNLEQQWLVGEGDAETLARILADDFVHPVPTGDFLSKAQHIGWSKAHPPPPTERHFEKLHARVYGDVAIVSGIVVSGTQRTIFTDVFVFRDGRWQAVNAQENPIVERGLPRAGFVELMNRLADAWNHGDARLAADCFTEDARYSSPPEPRVRRGREDLFRFFGGEHGRPRPMHMVWHHLVFDETQQLGAGEYTFDYDLRTHGMVLVRIAGGRIAQWREWEHASSLSFEALTKDNAF